MFNNVLWVFLSIFWINLVLCEVCDVGDENCTTKSANNSYGPFVNGIDNIVEASDPLHRDIIQANLPTIKYQLSNASMAGMKDCVVTRLKIERKESSFQFNLECPRIVISSEYEVKGYMADLFVEGKGTCRISCDDYVFMFNAIFEKNEAEDNKPHVHINSHDVDVEAKGRVEFEFRNLFDGDKVKSDAVHKFVNENWKSIDKVIRTPIVNSFMEVFMDNLNAFLDAIPVKNVLASDTIDVINSLEDNKLVIYTTDVA